MKTLTVLKYQWKDLIRGRWIIGYLLIYLLLTDTLIRFGGTGPSTLLSIANIMLLFIPLVSMIYGVLYLYQSREFIELLLAQPLSRRSLFRGLYGGLAIPLTLAFLVGTGLPVVYTGVLIGNDASDIFIILGLGVILTFIFVGIGFFFGLRYFEEKIKGFGFSLVSWLLLAVLYDGLILLGVFLLDDYPLEKPVLAFTLLNPIDLGRILVLMKFDISALMGYTGAVFNRFFGSGLGSAVAMGFLLVWMGLPAWKSNRLFLKKDF